MKYINNSLALSSQYTISYITDQDLIHL